MSTLRAGIKMALFTVVTLLATALLAATIANTDNRPTSSYGAVFVDAVNLNPGDEVRLAGVRVGSVSAVQLYEGTKAKVTFGVDRAVAMTTTTLAVIRYRNLIGQRYLAL
ncbi:MAG: phospholipid/cholesterol/gamma-HCH transport system substrate-binding protein, partial [Actinomycetota bacterium]|nr:phospholipid/cholesterol/gamma-HCH transport system substrate-binding protein [Actinomycetota bacterium]